ncbi:hypothetical protein BABINDRAFT_159678 [Babjeviella inositovora NRRL Y-12698]|uniref:High osmolarity signaling protein SHO1 n=1 Tax=Babjeviella inositovora NRRL Y-12698 TaxID=984486 RepID=A0A1E3R0B2_9ASCO|nr:uncharacterized protein BABINDRAFT_159678 [Babjeviella inositovora NRRL Y-12698]ODQ83244.1 hypothetical protein BABINDRAFT_159678 [Babjeviella inositovora NRRL Y-12698]
MMGKQLTGFQHSRFKFSNFFTDPFILTTTSLAFIAWAISFGSAIAYARHAASSPKSMNVPPFPKFTWWGLVFEVLLIFMIVILCCMDLVRYYKSALLGCSAVAFIYTTNSTNILVWASSGNSSIGACSAGSILLSIVNIIWIMYFGGDDNSPTNQYVDSFGLGGATRNAMNRGSSGTMGMYERNSLGMLMNIPISQRNGSAANLSRQGYPTGTLRDSMRGSQYLRQDFQDHNLRNSALGRGNSKISGASGAAYLTSNQLTGLENFSERDEEMHEYEESFDAAPSPHMESHNQSRSTHPQSQIEYKYKACALYSYDANPDDENEISFIKGEILHVDDITGKWWQARRSNGEIGICPSNYVELLD